MHKIIGFLLEIINKTYFKTAIFTSLCLCGACNVSQTQDTSDNLTHNIVQQQLQNDSILWLYEQCDTFIADLKTIEKYQKVIQKIGLSEDTLQYLSLKTDNWAANAYFDVAQKELQTLDQLGWDYNDYLNKLDFIKDILFDGYSQYPNTEAGLQLKQLWGGFVLYEEKCLVMQEDVARFLDLLASNSVKTAEEIDLLNKFSTANSFAPFSEKIKYHSHTYYLHQAMCKNRELETVEDLNRCINNIEIAVNKKPINDSLVRVAQQLKVTYNKKRSEILALQTENQF